MTDEPRVEEFNGGENEPATKGTVWRVQAELDELAQATAKGFAAVDQRFDRIEQTMATKDDLIALEARLEEKFATKHDLRRQVGPLLELLQSIDQQLKEHATHPDRIARLERRVLR